MMSEDEKENELFEQLGRDPDIQKAVAHYNLACEQEEEGEGCPICTALHALEVLEHVSDELKAPAFVKKVNSPPYVLAIMQKLIIWFSEATVDFLEFIDQNTDDDDDDDDEEEGAH